VKKITGVASASNIKKHFNYNYLGGGQVVRV
jgi:hypothetical protein